MKNISVSNISVLLALAIAMFMCGMAYEHYVSASAIDEIRASFPACPPAGRQLRGYAL
jgi:hypothetical protein